MEYRKEKIRGFIHKAALVVCVAACLSVYTVLMVNDVREQSFTALRESAAQNTKTIDSRLDGEFYVLETTALHLQDMEADDEEVAEMLNCILEGGEFTDAGLLKEGSGESLRGREIAYGGTEKTSVQALADGDILLTVAAGAGGLRIFGILPQYVFTSLLDMEIYGEKAQLTICDGSGAVVACNGALSSAVCTEIEGQKDRAVDEIFEVRAKNGETSYCIKTMLGDHGLFVICAVPEATVMYANSFILKNSIALVFVLSAIFIIVLIYVRRRDVRREKQITMEKELFRRSEERYSLLNTLSDSIIFDVDMLGGYVGFNHNYYKVFERQPYLLQTDLLESDPYIHPEDGEAAAQIRSAARSGRKSFETELRVMDACGEYIWYRARLLFMYDSDNVLYRVIGKLINIDRQKKQISMLQERADANSLTGLLNRGAMQSRVDMLLASSGTGLHALIVIDVDNFKRINDCFGHVAGDEVLRGIADVLRGLFRAKDFISRLGGDEFGVFMRDLPGREMALVKAKELCSEVHAMKLKGCPDVSCSVGVAFVPPGERKFEKLYALADAALYRAKAEGKNRVEPADQNQGV